MSKCVVHMMKIKSGGLGGIQSHNQREHESTKNKEIDYSKSGMNIDTVNDGNINLHRAVKERIAELDMKKAVRKDAVVYTSFIVSSDREFFQKLGEKEHIRRAQDSNESIALGIQEPIPFEYLDKSYQEDCIRSGSVRFFEESTAFFQQRYGEENVINGNIHFDETTPHMHLGIVPVKDNRLCAKELFTKSELRDLQSEFAKQVGNKFGLERGVENSKAEHLNEIDYKIKVRGEQIEKLDSELASINGQVFNKQVEMNDLVKRSESLKLTITGMEEDIHSLEHHKNALEGEIRALNSVVEQKTTQGIKTLGMNEFKAEMEKTKRLNLLERFVNLPSIKPVFEQFCALLKEKRKDVTKNRSEKEP